VEFVKAGLLDVLATPETGTARAQFAKVRSLLEDWFAEHPSFQDNQWLERFRSDEDPHFWGAFFELYCAALLRAHGYTYEREPITNSGRATRPEFVVKKGGVPVFWLESTVAAGDEANSPEYKRLAQVYEGLQKIESPNFILDLSVESLGPRVPGLGRLRSELKQALAVLDPDEATEAYKCGGFAALPSWSWEQDGWLLQFRPITKKQEARGSPAGRAIGSRGSPGRWIEPGHSVFGALKRKAMRYGELDLPYVIAVDAIDTQAGTDDYGSALFGPEGFTLRWDSDEATSVRVGPGIWWGPKGPINTRVSAVLFATWVVPHTIASAESTLELWHNPWTARPLDPNLWRVPQQLPDHQSQQLVGRAGVSARELLGIEEGWPGFHR
jgi:hypothetical protein